MDAPLIARDQMMDMAIAILRTTQDGDNLAPSDLKLVELAVNDMLNPVGIEYFRALYENATKPSGYTVPFLFGIEHLTIDHEGYIRWKGTIVEHFDHSVWRQPGWEQKMRADANQVAAACLQLEAEGTQPTLRTVVDLCVAPKADKRSDSEPEEQL